MSQVQQRRKVPGEEAAGEAPPLRVPLRPASTKRGLRAEGVLLALFLTAAALVIAYVKLTEHPSKQEAIGRELEGGLRLFTPDELRPFDGQRSSKIYLAIMGQVYDVSSGERHYGKGGGYSFFAARDASRAYVTGEFEKDLNDDVEDFSSEQFQDLVRWRNMYRDHEVYQLVGYVIGRFYDEDVHPRPLVSRAEQLAQQEDEARERRKAERAARYAEKQRAKEGGAAGGQQGAAADGADAAAAAAGQEAAEAMADHTPCNVRFTKAEGEVVWCSPGTFPRQVAVPRGDGQLRMRCACFAEDTVSAARRLYPGCLQRTESCATAPPQPTAAAQD